MNDLLKHLHADIKDGKRSIEDLKEYKSEFSEYAERVIKAGISALPGDIDILSDVLTMCNDYYVYSKLGDVLITDRTFDELTQTFIRISGKGQVVYTTFNPPSSSWSEKKHSAPNMIGSIEKVYSYEDAYKFVTDYLRTMPIEKNRAMILMTPKFDGASVVLTFKNPEGELVEALTRKDGIYGQDLTELMKAADVRMARNIAMQYASTEGFVDVKCEMLVSQEDFDNLCKIKPYRNRRAAASAISANPSNINLARYLTIKPLVIWDRKSQSKAVVLTTNETYTMTPNVDARTFEDSIERILDSIRAPSYPFRVDGVVITVSGKNKGLDEDIMSDSIAYKCNTCFAKTRVEDCYLSIGRTGKATPMIKVEPCDLNETTVTDISLSNFKKVNKYNLHISDEILVESAGDVIPMIKEVVDSNPNAPLLEYKDVCPHCGRSLKIVNNKSSEEFDLYCTNPRCTRVIAGKYANFFEKVGAKNISDGILIDIVEQNDLSSNISDLFRFIQVKSLSYGEGWGTTSISAFEAEMSRITSMPIVSSVFLGALGIPNVSIKKCKKLLTEIPLIKLMSLIDPLGTLKFFNSLPVPVAKRLTAGNVPILSGDKPYGVERAIEEIMDIDGFNRTTATTIVNYIDDESVEIEELLRILNIIPDIPHMKTRGNVVMSGFRDRKLAERIEELGFEYSDNITKGTVAVITESLSSKKAKTAMEKGIPLYKMHEEDKLIRDLENWD